MDFELSDTERILAETAKRVVARDVEPVLAAHPPDRALPKAVMLDLYRAMAELGYTGARIPEAEGGSGLSHVMLGLLNEALPPVLGFSLLGHESTTKRIHMGGTPEQKARFLPDLVAGKKLAGTAASEPNVGSDPRGIETTAVADGDHYVLNGTKLWITNGPILDLALVVASLGRDAAGRNLITRFIVDREESPFESRGDPDHRPPAGAARRASLPRLPRAEGKHARRAGRRAPRAHVHVARQPAEHRPLRRPPRCRRRSTRRSPTRSSARSSARPSRASSSCRRCSPRCRRWSTRAGCSAIARSRCSTAACGAIASRRWRRPYATEAAVRVTNLAIQLHGSYGLTKEAPLEGWARDARMLTLPDGTTQIHQLIIGRELVGLRAFA